ncbi:chromosome segregation protein SMC [Haloplanus sp. GCM10025708]|uniref:DUF7518 family protein n=1 Tax=Haloferacaceae TaxID=1644056 RepID=UPI00361C1AC4
MSNRVEELESQVAELQAAVDGLTEELVETRERLRRLESEHDVEVTRSPEPRSDDAESTETTAEEPATETETEADIPADEQAEDDGESDGNDIIVA